MNNAFLLNKLIDNFYYDFKWCRCKLERPKRFIVEKAYANIIKTTQILLAFSEEEVMDALSACYEKYIDDFKRQRRNRYANLFRTRPARSHYGPQRCYFSLIGIKLALSGETEEELENKYPHLWREIKSGFNGIKYYRGIKNV